MLQAQKLAEEKWANELALQVNETLGSGIGASTTATASVPVPEYNAATFDPAVLEQQPGDNTGSGGVFASWFGPSKEQRRAEAELKRFEKQFKERSADPPSLPPSYLPSAWAVLALMASLTFHALFFLLCRWLPGFEAASLFEPVRPGSAIDETCLVLVTPPPNRGKPEIVPMTRSTGAASFLQIEFQRQKYFYVPPSRLGADDRFPRGIFSLAACPVSLPVPHYLGAAGLRTEADVQAATERFGKNILAVHIPSFLELLKNQLLSPLSMFQVRMCYDCGVSAGSHVSFLFNSPYIGVLRNAVVARRVLVLHAVVSRHGHRLRGVHRIPAHSDPEDARGHGAQGKPHIRVPLRALVASFDQRLATGRPNFSLV
jgi:hypothetical protein